MYQESHFKVATISVIWAVFSISGIFVVCNENITTDNDGSSWAKYATDWVFFPDDTGALRFVNMTLKQSPILGNHDKKVHFLLYTRSNPWDNEELFLNEDNETNIENMSTYYNKEDPLRILVHGWISSGNSSTVVNMKDAYVKSQKVNVLIIDWSNYAQEPSYAYAANKTHYVGEQVGKMVRQLNRIYSTNRSEVHLVGHSLGAHVVGFAGRWLNKRNLTIARLTGLDPARPLFELPPIDGIRADDAEFVDIIHTNAGVLGVMHRHGVADFYPNGGGPKQPGCDGISAMMDACSHGRSHEYFTESILTGGFISRQCDSWSAYENGDCKDNEAMNMGELCLTSARRKYYLYTNSESPFSKD